MSGWETILMKERGTAGEGLLSYALYAHDGAPLARVGTGRPARLRLNPVVDDHGPRGPRHRAVRHAPLNTWTHLATTYARSERT